MTTSVAVLLLGVLGLVVGLVLLRLLRLRRLVATGTALDRLGRERGLRRLKGEKDAAFRKRIVEASTPWRGGRP